MSVKEHAIGKGTIAYSGESAEYWLAKTAKLRRGRARITGVIAGLALVLLAWLVSPLGPTVLTAHVLGSRLTATEPGISVIRVTLPDGQTGSYTADAIPPVGGAVTVTQFADGHLVDGATVVVSLWLIGLTLGAVAGGRGVWQLRQRHVTTILR